MVRMVLEVVLVVLDWASSAMGKISNTPVSEAGSIFPGTPNTVPCPKMLKSRALDKAFGAHCASEALCFTETQALNGQS